MITTICLILLVILVAEVIAYFLKNYASETLATIGQVMFLVVALPVLAFRLISSRIREKKYLKKSEARKRRETVGNGNGVSG